MSESLNAISEGVIGAAIEVHRALGPGLLESAYESCLNYELQTRGFQVQQQKFLPVAYKGTLVECGFRIDLLVNESVVVEVKAVERLNPIFDAQLLTYLKLLNCHLGLLINFNVPKLISGVKRIVNQFPDGPPSPTNLANP
jgi:GxxExxY protein